VSKSKLIWQRSHARSDHATTTKTSLQHLTSAHSEVVSKGNDLRNFLSGFGGRKSKPFVENGEPIKLNSRTPLSPRSRIGTNFTILKLSDEIHGGDKGYLCWLDRSFPSLCPLPSLPPFLHAFTLPSLFAVLVSLVHSSAPLFQISEIIYIQISLQIMLKNLHSEECRLLGCDAVWLK
jgi:hypothetical protein